MSAFCIQHTQKLNLPPLRPPRPLVTEGNERLIQQLIGQSAQTSIYSINQYNVSLEVLRCV
jgi:hypothetical protein